MILLLALWSCTPDEPRSKDRSIDVGALHFEGPAPKNLLMISIDTLRKDHAGRYDPDGSLTPFLDELAAESVVLDDFTQCSNWTFNSVSCTLAGREHIDAGFYPRFNRDLRAPHPPETPFLAAQLADAGFDTWLFSINSWLSEQWGTSQGYSHEVWPGIFHTDEIVKRAADQLIEGTADHDDPWFLHVHVKEPHAPYHAPTAYQTELYALPPVPWDLNDFTVHYDVTEDVWPTLDPADQDLLEQHLRARYRGEVAWLDDQLRARFDDLEARGLLDDTLVVIWSDHGEQFWEHGFQTHAYQLFGEENDAIALFWAKNLAPVAVSTPTTAIDLTPTLLEVFDVASSVPLTGHVVGTAADSRVRYASTQGRLGAFSSAERDGLKVIFHWSGIVRAFDRRTDPGETNDIWNPADPDQAALWDALRARVQAESALLPEETVVWP